MTKYTSFILF